MTRIVATGVPEKYPELGDIQIEIEGTDVVIEKMTFSKRDDNGSSNSLIIRAMFERDIKQSPKYPLCAEPDTMRCALFVLFEWFGEADSCWTEEPEHVKLEGEIAPMESKQGVIY